MSRDQEILDSNQSAAIRSGGRWHVAIFAGALALLVGAAIAFSVTRVHSSGPTTVPRGTPAGSFDDVLREKSKSAFSRHTNIDQGALVAKNDTGELPSDRYREATSMYVDYISSAKRSLRVYSGLSQDPLPEAKACPDRVSASVVSCKVLEVRDDRFSVQMVIAGEIRRSADGTYILQAVDWRSLAASDLGNIMVERAVRTYWVDGREVTARERVESPKAVDDDSAFAIPTEVLTAVSTDKELLIEPEPGSE